MADDRVKQSLVGVAYGHPERTIAPFNSGHSRTTMAAI
ncbi:protein of unknown function [Burkholderia multivorans]